MGNRFRSQCSAYQGNLVSALISVILRLMAVAIMILSNGSECFPFGVTGMGISYKHSRMSVETVWTATFQSSVKVLRTRVGLCIVSMRPPCWSCTISIRVASEMEKSSSQYNALSRISFGNLLSLVISQMAAWVSRMYLISRGYRGRERVP